MERLDKPEAKGILAFLGSTPPKSAEDAEKERKEREKASAEKRAEVEHKRSELRALRESWGLQAMSLGINCPHEAPWWGINTEIWVLIVPTMPLGGELIPKFGY